MDGKNLLPNQFTVKNHPILKNLHLITKFLVKKYLTNAFKKYPGIIFQEYIEGFDKENPEYRMYFVGNKYVYTIITTATVVDRPKAERGNFKENNLKRYKTFSRKVLKKLPDVIVDGVKLPRLLTRIDVSCCLEGPRSIL